MAYYNPFFDYVSWNSKKEHFEYNLIVIDMTIIIKKTDNGSVVLCNDKILEISDEFCELLKSYSSNFSLQKYILQNKIIGNTEFPFKCLNLNPVPLTLFNIDGLKNSNIKSEDVLKKLKKNIYGGDTTTDTEEEQTICISLANFTDFLNGKVSENINHQLKELGYKWFPFNGQYGIQSNIVYLNLENNELKFNEKHLSNTCFISIPKNGKMERIFKRTKNEELINSSTNNDDVNFEMENFEKDSKFLSNNTINTIIKTTTKTTEIPTADRHLNYSNLEFSEFNFYRWYLKCFQISGFVSLNEPETIFIVPLITLLMKKITRKENDCFFFPIIYMIQENIQICYQVFLDLKYFNKKDTILREENRKLNNAENNNNNNNNDDETYVPIPFELEKDFLYIQEEYQTAFLILWYKLEESYLNNSGIAFKSLKLLDVNELKSLYDNYINTENNTFIEYVFNLDYIIIVTLYNYTLAFINQLKRKYLGDKFCFNKDVYIKCSSFSNKNYSETKLPNQKISLSENNFVIYSLKKIEENSNMLLRLYNYSKPNAETIQSCKNILLNNNKALVSLQDYLEKEENKTKEFFYFIMMYYGQYCIYLDKQIYEENGVIKNNHPELKIDIEPSYSHFLI